MNEFVLLIEIKEHTPACARCVVPDHYYYITVPLKCYKKKRFYCDVANNRTEMPGTRGTSTHTRRDTDLLVPDSEVNRRTIVQIISRKLNRIESTLIWRAETFRSGVRSRCDVRVCGLCSCRENKVSVEGGAIQDSLQPHLWFVQKWNADCRCFRWRRWIVECTTEYHICQ